jgi:hypothetical protein
MLVIKNQIFKNLLARWFNNEHFVCKSKLLHDFNFILHVCVCMTLKLLFPLGFDVHLTPPLWSILVL